MQASQQQAEIEAKCRAQGLALTGQRRLILRALAEAVDHPDVLKLHNRLSAFRERMSLSTTYRTLRLFEAAGIVVSHKFKDRLLRYEIAPIVHHDHLIDVQNGHVMDFQSEEIEQLQIRIARQLGFQLVGHRLELHVVSIESALLR